MSNNDDAIRFAAGRAIEGLIRQKGTNVLSWNDISEGFAFQGRKIHWATKAAGIFKPAEITDRAALSIKQVLPSRSGRAAPYNDKPLESGVVSYQLQRRGTESHFNTLLANAYMSKQPLIFFRGLADSLYEAFYPVFVDSFSFEEGEAIVGFDPPEETSLTLAAAGVGELEARYGLGIRRTRLHQSAFRKRVLLAYGLRCALTNLPLIELLDATHIVRDSAGGAPSVSNGIALSTFHHGAYEKNLIGIDPDGKVHLSEQVSSITDGPMFDHGMLRLRGAKMRLPSFTGHHPSKDLLAAKFEEFRRHG